MKIMHCCLAAFYIDNYGYQENILPKIHKMQGHDVYIVASTENYLEDKTLGYSEARSYINEDGIPVTRLPYVSWLPAKITRKLRMYVGLTEELENFKPEVIFLHDVQFLDVIKIVAYVKRNPETKVFADGHTDFINSARNWVSKHILHKVIYKWCAKKLEPHVEKFFGVTPLRAQFFSEVYGIDKSKVDVLVMGYDDSEIDKKDPQVITTKIREKFNIKNSDFLIITGGKIDERKKIHVLIESLIELNLPNVKLLVFGTPTPEMDEKIKDLCCHPSIIYAGWSSQTEICDYLVSADLAFFPGTHSVIWEQAVGLGVPAVFKKWSGMTHIDVGGNCVLLDKGDKDEIKKVILSFTSDEQRLKTMSKVAQTKGKTTFSYREIAKKAIGLK